VGRGGEGVGRESGLMRPAIAIAVACAAGGALAQDYPARPLRFIVPSATGATTDVLARITAQKVAEQFGKQLIIDNRPGAGSVIGTDLVAKAAPDGHTIGMIYTTHTANASLQKLPYDPIGDFAHISMLTSAPLLLIVAPSLGVNSVRELIALAKTKPLNYGSAGVGSGGHMSGELFRMMAGISVTHIPHRGAAPASIDVAAGNLAFQFASQITVQALVRGGRLRVLAVTSAKRAASLPEAPTVAESGLAGFEVLNWFGVTAPAKTPAAIVARLNTAFARALQYPDAKEKLTSEGSELVGNSPAEFTAFLQGDLAKWAKVVKEAGIKID
jgi:tripartite-type tricarboxylate transporter receptor subunit TctC